MFNETLSQGITPKTWSSTQLRLLYKKGDKYDLLNYRGISLINCICKFFTQIIYFRLESFYEHNNILHESQMGFRKERGTADNIFCLMATSHIHLRLKKTQYVCDLH